MGRFGGGASGGGTVRVRDPKWEKYGSFPVVVGDKSSSRNTGDARLTTSGWASTVVATLDVGGLAECPLRALVGLPVGSPREGGGRAA